ncbi:WD40/YVTN/BNR-like repeat-containing protein [Desertibaculum subflavum]|uniref:WD40/YVTN/BNR-like repeat-containing protein n=1 Tax=Desertibaculum subflavum TaxID=2268458 RepID=UPI000E660E68
MTILAGTSKGVFKLTEGGQAACVLESRGVRDLQALEGRLFAATGAGLYRSDDGGASWSLAGMAEYEVWQVRGAGKGVLYAGTQPAALFRSADRGTTWTEVKSFARTPEAQEWCVPVKPRLPGRARALVIDAEDPRRIRVGVEVGGVMASDDEGESWRLVLPGDNPDLHMMCAHPARPATLFASTGYGRLNGVAPMVEGNAGVFRSDDRGHTWRYAWAGVTPRYSRPMCIDPRTPHGLTVASAPTAFSSFKDEGGAHCMLYRSEDGGQSWRSLCDGAHSPSAANIHGLAPDPAEAGGVIIGTDTGEVWRVSDRAEWKQAAAGLPAVLSVVAVH